MNAGEAKRVYLVTDGEYSDYQVLAVFSDREQAEAVQRLYNLIEVLQRDAEAARVACLALARLSDKPGEVSKWTNCISRTGLR